MGFLDYFLTKPDAPASNVQSVVAQPNRPYIHKPALDHAGLRKGMWVVTESADPTIGILTGCDIAGLVEITVAKPDGTTQMTIVDDKAVPLVVVAAIENVRQAYIEEIPESRRPDVESLRAMGYISASEAV